MWTAMALHAGDAEAATRVARLAAVRAGLPAPSLVRIGSSAVFRCGEAAMRVSPKGSDAAGATRLARLLADAGIPAPVPLAEPFDIGGWPVTIWPWLEKSSDAVDAEALGRIVAQLHALSLADIEPVLQVPSWNQNDAADPQAALDEIRSRSLIPARELERLDAVFAEHASWHDRAEARTVMCHGDIHPGNLLATHDRLWLIDWDSACMAPACWDHAMLTTLELWGSPPGFYAAFARGYGRDYSADPACRDLAVLRLLTATASLVVRAQWDPSAMAQVQVRLRYWMGAAVPGSWHAV